MEDFAQFALPEEERRRLLLSNLMMGLGAGLLDSRGKNVWPAISTGLLGGMQMGQQAIGQAQRGMVDSYKLKREIDADKEKKALAAAAAGKQAEYESALSGIFSGAPDLSQMGAGGPTPENAARVAPPDRIAQYRKAADFYMARNDVAKAKEAAAIADKMEEEYSTTPQTVRGADGKLQLVQFGKRGNAKVAEGMTPAEKLHFASTGSMAGVGLDPYSGSQVSAGLPMTMTPGEEDASKRGWANYRLSADVAKRAVDAAANPKPQLVDGQWVYPPDAGNPGGRAVPVAGMKPKEAPVPVEYKKLQTGIANLNSGITEYINALDNFSFADLANPSARAAMGTKYNNMMLQAKEAYQLGVLNGPDYMILQQVVTNPLTLVGAVTPNSAMKGQAEELRRIMKQASRNAAMVHGVQPQNEGMGAAKTVVRTGTSKSTGRKFVQYSDGTIEPQ